MYVCSAVFLGELRRLDRIEETGSKGRRLVGEGGGALEEVLLEESELVGRV